MSWPPGPGSSITSQLLYPNSGRKSKKTFRLELKTKRKSFTPQAMESRTCSGKSAASTSAQGESETSFTPPSDGFPNLFGEKRSFDKRSRGKRNEFRTPSRDCEVSVSRWGHLGRQKRAPSSAKGPKTGSAFAHNERPDQLWLFPLHLVANNAKSYKKQGVHQLSLGEPQ